MKESLRVLVRVDYEPTFTKSLEIAPILMEDGDDTDDEKRFFIVVSFSSEKDVDILHLLMQTKPRKTGAFVKNAMRLLLGPYYVLGCYLSGDERLNEAYQDRKLFFVSGGMPIVTANVSSAKKPAKQSKTKPTKAKKSLPSVEKTIEQESFVEETVIPPAEDVLDVTVNTSGEVDVFDDDDILSILENM
jgi:hypothetical protein